MSSIGVVVLRNSILGNAQVLQESVNNATNISNNAADRKPKREIIIVRKKQKIQPQPTVSVTSLLRAAENSATPTAAPSPAPARAAKRPRVRDDTSDDGRAPAPPLAVARRNARERNRVRQVNNGFAALRRHIPDEVAEAFESANSSRGPNKKPSKVETLRMAVEYIRNLESLLNIGAASDKENATRTGAESFPSPASSSSPRDTSFERSYFSINSPPLDDDEDETDSLPPPISRHQYARLPADVFQLTAASHLYEEDEGLPATPASDLIVQDELLSPQLLDANFHFMNSAEHFTIIHPEQNFGSEADAFDEAASELDVKYAETLRLADVHADMLGEESALLNGLSTIDPQLVLPQTQYLLAETPAGAGGEESCDTLELKRELAEAQVTAEDRQQFEETLKWWQEKTRGARPVLVSRDNVD